MSEILKSAFLVIIKKINFVKDNKNSPNNEWNFQNSTILA